MKVLNENGLNQLRAFLDANHVKVLDSQMVRAWATELEWNFNDGNGACIELPACDSITKKPIIFEVTESGLSDHSLLAEYDQYFDVITENIEGGVSVSVLIRGESGPRAYLLHKLGVYDDSHGDYAAVAFDSGNWPNGPVFDNVVFNEFVASIIDNEGVK